MRLSSSTSMMFGCKLLGWGTDKKGPVLKTHVSGNACCNSQKGALLRQNSGSSNVQQIFFRSPGRLHTDTHTGHVGQQRDGRRAPTPTLAQVGRTAEEFLIICFMEPSGLENQAVAPPPTPTQEDPEHGEEEMRARRWNSRSLTC